MTDKAHFLKQYARNNYKKIDGWLNAEVISQLIRLNDIQHKLQIHGHVGEIGVHHGKLFILLYLLARENEQAIAIDIFDFQELNRDKSGHGSLQIFEENLRRYAGNSLNLKVINKDSTTIGGQEVKEVVGGCLRMFSIDGGHLSNIVRHDLTTAADLICDGGVIILDDYFNPEFPGVAEGTNLFFVHDNPSSERSLVPFLVTLNKIYLTTVSHAELYMDHLTRLDLGLPYDKVTKFRTYDNQAAPIRLTEFFGANVLSYSPDNFNLRYKIGRNLRRSRSTLRAELSETTVWRRLKGGRLGGLVKRVADKFVPY